MDVQIALDHRSIWTDLTGDSEHLDLIEDTLGSKIAQELGGKSSSGSRMLLPWVRKSDSRLRILSGILTWAWPEGALWPSVWRMWDHGDDVLEARAQVLEGIGYRDYQIEAIWTAITAPLGRGILELGTGAGKTYVALGLAYMAGGDWTYVVYGRDIVKQAGEKFRELQQTLSKIEYPTVPKSKHWNIESYSWGKVPSSTLVNSVGLITDECHNVGAKKRAELISKFKGPYRIGLSGTPLDRTDSGNSLVVGLLGPNLFTLTVDQLVAMGNLSRGKVVMVRL